MIALTTPTGTIGSKVLRNLVEAHAGPIRVLARDPGRLQEALPARVEVVQGTLEDPAALRRLLDGAGALFWCQPDAAAAADYVGAYTSLARAGAAAMREAGLARVVAISAAGEPGATPAGPITALHRMEGILAETGASIRFLRCGSFFDNLLWQWDAIMGDGYFTYPMPGDIPGPQVATADIARVAADLLMDGGWTGRATVPLLGPVDLTYDEMASILSQRLGRRVDYRPCRPEELVEAMRGAGQSAAAAEGLVAMFAFLADGYATPEDADRSLTPTRLEDWLREVK